MEQILKDVSGQAELRYNGFVKSEVIDSEILQRLQNLYEELKPINGQAEFFTSTLSTDFDYRKKANDGIIEILSAVLKKIFTGFQAVNANFMVKPSGDKKTTCHLHQDWTYVDEEKYLALNIWIPLIELTAENGAMRFIKGSHLFDKRIRGRNIYWPYYNAQDYLIENFSEPVFLKKGEPVIFIGKTFHYSPPNISGKERVGVSVVVTHKQAPLMNYYSRNGTIYRALVDAAYFTTHGVNSVDFEKDLNPQFFAYDEDYNQVMNHALMPKASAKF